VSVAHVSPSDLNHFLECEHLMQLERRREAHPDRTRDPHAELLASKGLEHERAWLRRLADEGRAIVTIEAGGRDRDWAADAARTVAAMRDGADVIYQGVLVEGAWRGVGDFLVRVGRPSALGTWSYEAWDTKLARRSRPYYILQLCFYSGQLGRVQGVDPDCMHVVLGTGERESFQYAEFDAYYRAVRRRFLEALSRGLDTYPYPVSHCGLCEHAPTCRARWQADDHLSLVAGIRRRQVERLIEAGVRTMTGLATIDLDRRIGIGRAALERLRHQAALQTHHRRTGQHRYELLPPGEHTGFRLLPAPSQGDIFFDMEGDPYFEPARGLEYLFGLVTLEARAGRPSFHAIQALSRDEEARAFERFVDLVHERLREWPDLHVYHYAPYEITALKRLMGEHATREEALDDLLRREVFVDLYQVVRQSMRISHPGYSIKQVRTFFMTNAGQGGVADGADSILAFERWRETRDPALIEAIVRYNEEDCVSTLKLRDWLIERKAEAEREGGAVISWKTATGTDERMPARVEEDVSTAQRRAALEASGTDAARLLADLLLYHRREAKSEWWAYFDRRQKSLDDLMDDAQAIARLEPVPGVAPEPLKRSLVHTLQFPDQEFKLGADPGSQVDDPFRLASAGSIEWLDARAGRLGLKRGPSLRDVPLPSCVTAASPLDTRAQRAALGRVADEIIAHAGPPSGPVHRYAAIHDLLERVAPRIGGVPPGMSIQTLDLEAQTRLVSALDESCLFIQGPPGSGKTWTGARLIVSLIRAGRRVGVAANSHKAINNLLEEVERVAVSDGVALTGLKKGSGDDELRGRLIQDTDDNRACETANVKLIAGTTWLFSRPGMDQRLDYLFVDEAGQVALADAVAMGTAARNLVLLGDPQQLPQVRQGVHPDRAGCSVLEHLLAGASTVSDDRGIFLAQTWRMHPDVCRFVSALSYDQRLESAPGRERQRIESSGLSGTGLRFIPVAHTGSAQQSREEAEAIAREVQGLLADGTFTDADGRERRLTPADILVVAPYNMQVRCLAGILPAGVAAGTVDRFQGREAPIVFFSMASSSGEDVPRGLEFLFSRNRFNVAVSRARAMAVVVCAPSLLHAPCRTVDQMRLVNAVCRFAEQASGQV
jgi:uncharacterized protein